MSSCSQGWSQERCRNSTSGTSGSSSLSRGVSSSFASGDLLKRGWYWSRIPRSLPESSSGSIDARNSANALLLIGGLVMGHRPVRLDVEDEPVGRPLRPAPGHVGVGQVVEGRVHLDGVEPRGVVGKPGRGAETPRGYQCLIRPSSAQLHVPIRTVAGMIRA